MSVRRTLLLGALMLAGRDRAAEPPPTGTPAAAAPDPLTAWALRMPDSLTHRASACPFECCVYGTWEGTAEVPLRAAPRRPDATAHVFAAGEPFTADSGFVRNTGISILTLDDTLNVGPTLLQPGDTVAVLDYVGEGRFNIWDGANVWEVESFWGQTGAPVSDGQYAREWWVHATTADGRKGWIDADSVPTLKGADACGG